METTLYDHYIAIDWSMKNMAIARMTAKLDKPNVIDVPSDVVEARVYLDHLKGSKILAIEETTTSQWLYTELKDSVDRILICDPYRNRLLSEGPKTDKIDATKLVQLLKANLLKEVYHSSDKFLKLRRLVSGYEDLIRAGIRLKNQRSALLRACGKSGKEKGDGVDLGLVEKHVLESLDRQIKGYEEERKSYLKEFKELSAAYPEIRNQRSLPGIDWIHAVKIVSRVVSPCRFANKGHYLSYAGLIKLDRISGGKSYGRKNSRYSRQLKSVYKTGAFAAVGGNNPINDYYEYLIKEKGCPEYQALHKASRRLAVLSWGVLKSGKKYESYRRDHVKTQSEEI